LVGFGIAFVALVGMVAVGVVLARGGLDKGKPPAGDDKAAKADLNDLSLEVAALQTIHGLKLTPAQLDALAELARDADLRDDRKRQAAKAGDDLRKALAAQHQALLRGDDDKVDEAAEAVTALREKDGPDLDDAVAVTAAARKRAPEFLRRLTARQVGAYLTDPDEPVDPPEALAAALDGARKLSGKEWDAKRAAVAEELAWLLAGADADAADKAAGRVKELLDRAHGLKDADYKEQRDDLDKEAGRIVGGVGPTDVIRHYMERALAELLSNPRLGAAIEARRAKK
jgi:hypothetical protein